MPILYHYTQFKDSGKLIEAGQNGSFFKSLFGKSPYKNISSMSDLSGDDLTKFKSIMKIGENGLSEYNMADIKAKSSMLGFGDSLTNEITALAKDADFTAKAATGKLTFAKALEDGTISTEELGDALKNHLQTNGAKKKLKELADAAEEGGKTYQDSVRNIIEGSDDVANAVIKSGEQVSQKTDIFSSAASLGKGMLTGAKKLVKSVGPYAIAAAAVYGGYKLWDHSQTKYTRANEALNKSSGEYETTKTELTSLNSQLDETKSKIEELESLKRTSGGKLSLTDEAELSTLQKQNDELERQITLKQNMADNQAEIVAKDAKSVAKTGQTYTEAMREEHGKVLGTLMGITGHLANPNSGKTASETWAKENGGKNGKATLEQQMKANLKTLKKYKKQLKEAQEDEDQDATDKAQENVDKMTAKVSKQASKLQDIIDKSKDANGNVLKSMASTVDDYNSLITEFNNIDLTKKQKDVNNLDNFFNSSSGSSMKDYLSDIVQNGGSATDALKAFREAGGRLKDIDVSKGSFLEYFDEVKKQAEEAKEAIKTVDGTVQGVTEAFNSANQDANWSTMADYLKQADDLFAKGKVGTDDFKTAAQFMSPTVINPDEKDNNGKDKFKYDSEAYTKAWTNAQAKVKRYFDSENPFDSAQHFVDDLTSKGFALKSGDEFEWTKKFKSSAAAAKELGLSVEATEVLMRNLESYGAEFDDVVFSSENLKSYKSSLDGIKTILDEMGDGEKRERLQKLYEGWDSEYEKYQNDMDSLSNDVVVKIKFEYDLASIQQKVDEIQSSWDNGDKSAKTGATLLAAKERELKLLEDQLKYTAGQDKGYDNSKKSVSDISTKLSKTTDKDKIRTLQEQKGAFLDLQNAFNIFKNDGGQLNWSEFLKSDQATSTLNDIISKTDITKEKLADLLGVDSKDLQINVDANTAEAENKLKGIAANDGKTIVMDVNANTDQIQNAIDALQDGQTLMFNATAKIDGKDVQKQVTAENVNGEIHYKTVIDNKEVELVKNQDGTFKIKTVVDDTAVEDEKNKVEKNPLTQEVDADTTKASGKLDGLVAQDGKTIVLDVNASTDEVQDKLNMLKQGQTVVFTANVDNATQAVEAIRNEKGELEYYVTLEDGSKTKLTELGHQNGEFVFSADTSKVKDAENAIQNLQAQLASGNLSEKQTVKVQAEVANLQSLQNEILSAFHDAHPEITAETNTDQATKTFQDWVASAEGQEVITKVTGDNKDALEKINELVDKDYNTKVKSEFDGSGAKKGAKETKDKIESEEVTMKGKVDLTNRPQIPASKLSDVGWENAGDGTATVFSSSYSNEAGDKTVVVTPILPNGDVFEPGALEEYAQNLLDGGKDTEGLEIRTYVGDDSIEKANKYAEALHQVQDAYYLGDDAQKQALSSLQDFNDEQLKAIDLSDGKYSEGEQQLESLMNSLGVGKESLSEFVDVLSDMGLIKVTAEVDAEDNATPVINKVSEAQIKEKIAQITGKDAATPVLTTWNTLSADDKFASLTADDQATIAVELWNGLSADPKFTELSADDQATTVVNLWNAMNANPKFSELSAQDKATATVQTYNALSLKDKNSLISQSGGETAIGVASRVASVINSIPSSRKSVITLTTIKETINKVVTQAGSVKHANGGSIAGGAMQLNGTAHVSGTVIPKLSRRALAMGTLKDDSWLNPQWMTTKDEVALTGEKNEELVVNPRLNRWYTVGTNGAEFAHIPAGSVVFNSRQTKELLSKGYTNSRAKGTPNLSSLPAALLNGTAYANGLKLKKNNSVLSSTKKSTRSKSSRTSKAKSSSGSNTKSKSNSNSKSSESAEKSEELLDWIETLLSRTSRLTELATSAVDRAVGLANKQNALVDAVTKTQNEITTNQNAANKYFAQANSLGLAQGYVDKIKNGTLNIESITDDNLKDKISKYKDYYEKGLSAQDKVLDLQDKLNELYQKRLEIIEKEYDTIVEINDSLKDKLDAKISYNSAYGVANDNQDNISSINKSIKAQEDTINQLTKKLDAYQKEVNSQITSGTLKKGSEDYRSAQKNLNDFTANIYKASQELIELQDKLVQLRVDAIQTIIDTFKRRSDKLDKYASLLEAKDETVPESVYQERLDNNNDTIRKNQEARAIWLKRQATEDVNSDNYKKYAEEIQKLDESTLDLMKDNEDLKNSIYSLRIKNLEDAIQGYDDLETELKGFRDLLNDDAFLDKKGGITDEGLAQITLLSQSIGNAKQKISDLTTGLQKVKELYDNGVISLKEYNEKSAEYRKELQSSTSDVKSYQKSLTDLYQNALKTEVDALQKVISKRKEATQAKEEYYSYDRKIREQSNDVNSLKAQIAALEGVKIIIAPYIKSI